MNELMNAIQTYLWPIVIVFVSFLLIILISCFRIFEKANIDGYKVLIPIYDLYLLLEIADLPIFFIPLFFIPIVNIFVFWFVSVRLGNNFSKSTAFKIGMCIFPFIFYPILAFSRDLYKAYEESVKIRMQDQKSTLYNQFPDITETIPEISSQGTLKPQISKEMPVSSTVNALGIKTNTSDEFVLDIDDDSTWNSENKLSEIEQSKKVVEIDPIKDDPLLNPDAKPIKVVPLDQYKVCPHCKTRLDLDAKICFLCGQKIEEEQ